MCENLPLTTSFICFLEAPLGSLISNHVSCQAGIMLGGLLASTGLILSSFATSLEHLYLSLGVLTGRMHSAPLLLPEHKTGMQKMMGALFSMSHWRCTGQIEIIRPVPIVVKERLPQRELQHWLILHNVNAAPCKSNSYSLLERGLSIKFWNYGRSGRTAVAADIREKISLFCQGLGGVCYSSLDCPNIFAYLEKSLNQNTNVVCKVSK